MLNPSTGDKDRQPPEIVNTHSNINTKSSNQELQLLQIELSDIKNKKTEIFLQHENMKNKTMAYQQSLQKQVDEHNSWVQEFQEKKAPTITSLLCRQNMKRKGKTSE
jgi:hypothetical protein